MATDDNDFPTSDRITERLQTIKLNDLPVLRQTIIELKNLSANQDDLTTIEIADVILHDPLMTLKVLSSVNATRRGRFDTELSTIEHGLITLGITPFFNSFDTLYAVEDKLQTYPAVLNEVLMLASRAYHAAYQADSWAMLRMDVKSEEVYISALLHDVAEMVLWCSDPAAASKVHSAMLKQDADKKQAVHQVFHFDLQTFQAALFDACHMPQVIKEFMDPENAVRPRILGGLLAASIAKHTDSGWYSANLGADIEVLSSLLHISFDDAMVLVQRNAIHVAHKWKWYQVPPAAKWLPMLPDPSQKMLNPEEDPGHLGPRPQPAKLQQAMQAISELLNETLELHDMMSVVLKGMHEGLGLSRVVFALLTPDHASVKAKYVLGDSDPAGLRRFQFDLRTNHLFSNLMCRPQSIWLNAGNSDTFGPLITDEMLKIIGEGEFYAMSVFVHGKPVGLFYADRRQALRALDEHCYREFKKLSLRAAEVLGHLVTTK